MSSNTVERIKERLSIVDVVAPYTELHKAGKHFKGKSPFTNENTPSFFVSPDRGMYYCFSSSKGGDIFTFIQEMEGVDFKGALQILAERANVELVKEDPKKRNERDKKFALIDAATAFFEARLTENPNALAYLHDRGVTKESIQKWRIGYAPDAWRELKMHLAGSGFSIAEMQSAGLIKGDPGKEPYDVFRDRVMFPIADSSGRIVAFSGRLLKKDDKAPKYVNSPETELFNKSEVLFGYDKAKHGIRKFDFSLLVEGQFDLVLTHQAGYANTVAVSGTALSEQHVALLGRLSNRAVLALDSDRAGIEAMKRAATLMLARGMDVKVTKMESGKDPADIINEDKEAFKKLVGSGMHVIEFLLAILKEEAKDERAFKLRAREEILPYLLLIPDYIDREHFETVIASTLGTTKDAIHYEVERLLEKRDNSSSSVFTDARVESETQTSGRMSELSEYLVMLGEVLKNDSATNQVGAALLENLEKAYTKLPDITDEGERSKLLFSIEGQLETIHPHALAEDIASKLNELHTERVKRAIATKKNLMKEAELSGDAARIDTLLTETAALQKEFGAIEYDAELFMRPESSK